MEANTLFVTGERLSRLPSRSARFANSEFGLSLSCRFKFFAMLYKKFFLPVAVSLVMIILFHSYSFSQITKEQLSRRWVFVGVEEFGVVRPPDSTAKNDFIEIKTDGTFDMEKAEKKANGNWTFNEKTGVLSLFDLKTKKTINYTIKSMNEKEMVIEYQSPDLVRTRYHYSLPR